MPGIQTSWKRSRISKIIAVILPLPLLLLSFLLGGVEVFADGEYVEHVDHWVSNSDMQITAQNTEREATQGVAEYKIYLRDKVYLNGVVGLNTRLDGYLWLTDRITFDVFAINGGTADPTSKITNIEVISFEFLNTIDSFSLFNYSTFSESVSDPGSGYDQYGRTLKYNRNIKISLNDFHNPGTNWIYFSTCLTVRAYYENSNPTHYYKNFYYNLNLTNQSYSCSFSKNTSDYSLLNTIKDNTGTIANSVDSVNSSINSAASQAHTDASTAHSDAVATKNAINTAASQAHTDAQTAHSDAVATKNAINTAASQAHTDAQTAHNDALKTQDILQNDRTSFSSGMDSLKNDVDTQQGLADTAVDNSVHNYSGALTTIDNVDYDNFFAGQSSPATFWRDVGEYVLDPSNLGQFAGGLVIVTVITLFVFMLRL